MPDYKLIPYGVTDFKLIQSYPYYYVDKTHFIPLLETVGRYLFLIRPRRFGKSLLLAVLQSYYDAAMRDDFEAMFTGTTIHAHTTAEKNAYLLINLNFSAVNPDVRLVEASFQTHVNMELFFFGKRYQTLLGEDYFTQIERYERAEDKIEFVLKYTGARGLKVYILIDEYDNFANTILATAGTAKYHELTHGAGFFRSFFNVLKAGTTGSSSGLGRLFITGVSPVTMDDVTSGFNIGENITVDVKFNDVVGFTEQEVRSMLGYYQEHGIVIPEQEHLIEVMTEWYDHYRFSRHASYRIFNSDMVLYFVQHLIQNGDFPDDMIDHNVRIDYGKLRHLVVLDRQLNGNFARLADIIKTEEVAASVVTSFPVERLIEPENFVSLLFYFGLLTYSPEKTLKIPNRTVKTLMYSYLREAYRDVQIFRVDFFQWGQLLRQMAVQGAWEPVFRFLTAEIERQTSIRDYLTGEKVIQTFCAAYLNFSDFYLIHTEEELGKGFADLYLEPFAVRYPEVTYAYLIELKYLTRSETTEARIQEQLTEARAQLRQYADDDRIRRRQPGIQMKLIALVFSGWELKLAEEFPEQEE